MFGDKSLSSMSSINISSSSSTNIFSFKSKLSLLFIFKVNFFDSLNNRPFFISFSSLNAPKILFLSQYIICIKSPNDIKSSLVVNELYKTNLHFIVEFSSITKSGFSVYFLIVLS